MGGYRSNDSYISRDSILRGNQLKNLWRGRTKCHGVMTLVGFKKKLDKLIIKALKVGIDRNEIVDELRVAKIRMDRQSL